MRKTVKNQKVEVTRKIVGERIGRLRCSINLSQEKLAEIVDVSRLTVWKWEKGKYWPTLLHLVKLAELFGCSIDYLVLGTEIRGRDKEEDQIGLILLNRTVRNILKSICFCICSFCIPEGNGKSYEDYFIILA